MFKALLFASTVLVVFLVLMISLLTTLQYRDHLGPNALERMARLNFFREMLVVVERMVRESGHPLEEPFDEFTWLMKWLADYNPALGGPPIGYINTPAGRKRVYQALQTLQSGAYL